MDRQMERQWERRLNISTAAADYEKSDSHHSPYEPTAYPVLERLARSGFIRREDVVVDYGCGKGRVGFYLNYALGCRTVGVEYDPRLHACAMENLAAYAGRREGVAFVCAPAESYRIGDANCFYFFNPFSERVLRSVLGRILEAWYARPREMKLFFYYATDATRAELMAMDMLERAGEIDCRDLFGGSNPLERILLFRIG